MPYKYVIYDIFQEPEFQEIYFYDINSALKYRKATNQEKRFRIYEINTRRFVCDY